jgi:thioesterase domain-containing protein
MRCLTRADATNLSPFPEKSTFSGQNINPRVTLFEEDPLLGWGGMAVGGIEVHQFPGNHSMYLLEPVIAAVVAAQLGACLEQANKKALENATPRN